MVGGAAQRYLISGILALAACPPSRPSGPAPPAPSGAPSAPATTLPLPPPAASPLVTAPGSASSLPPTVGDAGPGKIGCGASSCEVGKEACCFAPGYGKGESHHACIARAPGPWWVDDGPDHVRLADSEPCSSAGGGAAIRYCDGSSDCPQGQRCCWHYVGVAACEATVCESHELCAGDDTCRTPGGAACVHGQCRKPSAAVSGYYECSNSTDCLAGEKCCVGTGSSHCAGTCLGSETRTCSHAGECRGEWFGGPEGVFIPANTCGTVPGSAVKQCVPRGWYE
jgi:hypothetical protein